MGQVVSCEAAAVVTEWKRNDQRHANDGDDKTGSTDEDAVLVSIARDTACDKGDDFDGAAWGGVKE